MNNHELFKPLTVFTCFVIGGCALGPSEPPASPPSSPAQTVTAPPTANTVAPAQDIVDPLCPVPGVAPVPAVPAVPVAAVPAVPVPVVPVPVVPFFTEIVPLVVFDDLFFRDRDRFHGNHGDRHVEGAQEGDRDDHRKSGSWNGDSGNSGDRGDRRDRSRSNR